ncbi:MAG: hypothetical protein ACMUHB_00460, partial [Thermoplasmatota archaeon]
TSIENGKTYYYYFTAENYVGESVPSDILTVFDDLRPVFLGDFSPENATTGDNYPVKIGVTDNVDVTSVHVRYWFDFEPYETLYLEEQVKHYLQWWGSIPVPSRPGYILRYNVTAFDPSGNRMGLPVRDVEIFDNDAPTLGTSIFLPNAFTNETYTFSVDVIDNSQLHRVWVEYHYGTGKDRELNLSLNEGFWEADIQVENTLNTLYLTYFAVDLFGNTNSWGPFTVNIFDDEPPFLLGDLSDPYPTTGDTFIFKASITDNIQMGEIWVEYWYNKENRFNVSLSNIKPHIWTYSIKIMDTPPSGMSLNYLFHAKDSSNNWMLSDVFQRTIIDNDAPIINDGSDDRGTTGDPFHFNFEIQDNIGLEKAYLIYTLGDITRKIELHDYEDFSFQLELPVQLYGYLEYYAQATDVFGNMINSSIIGVKIFDNDPPRIENIEFTIGAMSYNSLETGKEYIIKAVIWEINGLNKVRMEYWYDGEVKELEMTREVLFQETGHFSCTTTLRAPNDRVIPLNFRIIATDDSGNTNITKDASRPVKDVIFPNIEPIADLTIVEGDILDITPVVDDNIGVDRVEWEGSPIIPTQGKLLGVVSETGIYEIKVTVFDEEGNSNSTTFTLTVERKEEGISAGTVLWIVILIALVILIIAAIAIVLFIKGKRPREAEELPEKEEKVITAGPRDERFLPTQRKLPPQQAHALKPKPSVITPPASPPIYKTAEDMPRAPMPLRGDDYISPGQKGEKTESKTQLKGELGPKETNMLNPRR